MGKVLKDRLVVFHNWMGGQISYFIASQLVFEVGSLFGKGIDFTVKVSKKQR